MSDAPIYRAYKPVHMTDGLQKWVKHTFDDSVAMTPDDKAMLKAVFAASSSNARITAMQSRLRNLQELSPSIKIHADAIRAIHSSIGNPSDPGREGHEALDRADELWFKILVMRDLLPKAVMGAKNSKVQSNRAKAPRKLSEKEIQRIVATYRKYKEEGSVYGVVKALARCQVPSGHKPF